MTHGRAPFPRVCNKEQAAVQNTLIHLTQERKLSYESKSSIVGKGDFTWIAASVRESGETLMRSLGVAKGMKVLDLGCGDGTTALPAAKLGADVLGVDIARNLVAAGNRRAQEYGLTNCRFQEGDACNLAGLKTGHLTFW